MGANSALTARKSAAHDMGREHTWILLVDIWYTWVHLRHGYMSTRCKVGAKSAPLMPCGSRAMPVWCHAAQLFTMHTYAHFVCMNEPLGYGVVHAMVPHGAVANVAAVANVVRSLLRSLHFCHCVFIHAS
jgi:hypothetical protein